MKNKHPKKEDLSTIITPAQAKGVSMNQQSAILEPIPREELTRRQTLVARILEKSKERNIAPLTTSELVRQARAKERRSYASQ